MIVQIKPFVNNEFINISSEYTILIPLIKRNAPAINDKNRDIHIKVDKINLTYFIKMVSINLLLSHSARQTFVQKLKILYDQ